MNDKKISEIIYSDFEIEDPFAGVFYHLNKNEEFDYEWHIKTTSTHYKKLLCTVQNILEVQEDINDQEKEKTSLHSNFSMITYLEYFYIKSATIFDLLDILYKNYFSIDAKNKKELEDKLINAFNEHMNFEQYEKIREQFKKEIINTRNRLIHDEGYSIKVYKHDDNVLSFQLYDSDVEELLTPNVLYNYNSILLNVSKYVVYNFVLTFFYIKNIIDLINKKDIIPKDEKKELDMLKDLGFSSEVMISLDGSFKLLKKALTELEHAIDSI